MIDDHTSFIKSGNGTQLDSDNRSLDIGFGDLFNPRDAKPIIIEGSTNLFKNMYLTMSASTSLLGNDTENFDNYSATLTYNGKIKNIPYMVGSSVMVEDDLDLRIGIHQGDIFIKDGDVFGDDVNIASRVEGFAPTGGIALSDKVHKDISGVSDIKTSFIGHRKLKGVEQETRIRCITSHNLPINKKSNAPILAAYLCFFMSASLFLRFGFHPIFELYLTNDPLPIKDYSFAVLLTNESMTFMIKYFVYGLSYLLIGYSCLSYHKGLSAKSQKLLVLLAYVCVLSPIVLLIFNPEAQALNAQMIHSVWLMSSSLLLFFVVLPIVIIILFKTYYYMKKHYK